MKSQVFFFLIVFVLSWGCHSEKDNHIPGPDSLLQELSDDHRFASTDQVADWLIQKDPSLLLVDVRPTAEFTAYALPGAINVPLEKLTAKEEQEKLNCDKYFLVFYSNGTVLAEKAWMINRRLGCTSGRILMGGLNEWTTTILDPQEPPATASNTEFEIYQFRKAANLYFAGGSKSLEAEPYYEPVKVTRQPVAAKKTVPLKPKPKKVEEEEEEDEGC